MRVRRNAGTGYINIPIS